MLWYLYTRLKTNHNFLLQTKRLGTSAAKCREHHEIFTNEYNEHIRGSLMLIDDSQ